MENEKQKMSVITEENFRSQVEKLLKHEFMRGMESGVYAVCQVLLRKALAKDKTPEERLTDVVKFCMTAKKPGKYNTAPLEDKIAEANNATAVEKMSDATSEESKPSNEIELPAQGNNESKPEDAQ